MDIVKVNKGSDIKLTVHLNTKYLAPLNIHSVQAYLVNTSVKSDLENKIKMAYDEYNDAVENKKDKIQFISRFPMEPHDDGYISSSYNICQCGYPHYHARPHCHKPMYCGFGVYPHTFDGFKNHLWAHYDMEPLMKNIENAKNLYNRFEEFLKYQAYVEDTQDPSTILVYFPGKDLLELGVYKLIIVAQVYQPGYSKFSNFKTITVDYDNVFELVETGGGDAIITVGVAPTNPSDNSGLYTGFDRYVVDSEYDGAGHINLILNDGSSIAGGPINIESETEWFIGN